MDGMSSFDNYSLRFDDFVIVQSFDRWLMLAC